MYISSLSLVAVACQLTLTLASVVPAVNLQPRGGQSRSSRCYTQVATTSGPRQCPTAYTTHYTPCISTSISTKTTTTTPSIITSTLTTTTTTTSTAMTATSTATVTSVVTTTGSTTSVVTAITTTTTTTSGVSTSTIAAPAGFTPIQSSLPGAAYDGAFGGSQASKRELSANTEVNDQISKRANKKLGGLGPTYPQSVQCHIYVPDRCSTTTKISTSTVLATGPTTTVTSTSTVTTTIFPSASTTTTITSTATTTSTIFSTTTVTATSTSTIVSVTSVYAACATNNFADSVNGVPTTGGTGSSFYSTDVVDASSLYDCCVAAFTYPSGAAQAFGYGSNICEVAYTPGETCGAVTQASNPYEVFTEPSATNIFAYGNGCDGEFTTST